MFWFFSPWKKTTPAEYAVLVVFASAICIILGVVALVVGFREQTAAVDDPMAAVAETRH
jgi:hypothetical protein